ncbi:MAG: YezD family protein [Verrucomicrobiota bacterium]
MAKEKTVPVRPATLNSEQWLEEVQHQVNSLQYGVVQIVVHNARVTQIDRTERVRLDPPPVLSFSNRQEDGKE